jgi:hypothetical protein
VPGRADRELVLHLRERREGNAMVAVARDLDRLAHGADAAGDRFGGMASHAHALNTEIQQTQVRIRDLGRQFAATGDTSLFGDIRKERAHLRELERIAKEARGLGAKAGGGLSGMFDLGGSGIRPMHAAIGGLVAFAAAAAPAIGAMIAGAVTGAVGLGGIAGGIFAASRDPGVERAWQQFASNVSSKFFQMGTDIAEPLVAAAGQVEQAFDNLGLDVIFKKAAPYIDDLAIGLEGFATNLGIGLSKAMDVAGPALELLGRNLPGIGDALGYMFSRMAEGRGTLEGFLSLISFIEAVLRGTGNVIGFLSDVYHNWLQDLAVMSGVMEDIPGPLQEKWKKANDTIEGFIEKANVGQQVLNGVSRGFLDTAQSIEATTNAVRKLNEGLFDQQNRMLALSNASLAYKTEVLALKDAVKEHGKSLSDNTEAGLANQQMINALVGDLMRERDAAIEAANGNQAKTDKANANYQTQIAGLKRLLLNLGFEKAAVDRLVGAYDQIPTRITTTIITDYQTRGVPPGEHSGPRIGETRGRAAGGPIWPGNWIVGERGPERMRIDSSGRGYVTPLTSGGGGSAGVVMAAPVVVNGAGLGDLVFNWLVREIGNRGGTLAVLGVH